MKAKIISLLSGKGGAGKTIIGLSAAKVLSEAGLKVLVIDCDMSTHGATYFFENEIDEPANTLTLDIILSGDFLKQILRTKAGFDFIPSTLKPELSKHNSFSPVTDFINNNSDKYDVILFDCQAGYSELAAFILELCDKNLVILEADSVSASAIRVLFLQIGKYLKKNNTWQLFNKLSEEEREVYKKTLSITLFPGLPPIPFDWKVRAAFALSQIPSVKDNESAFGLAILRLFKIVIDDKIEILDKYEKETVGDWFSDIQKRIALLTEQRNMMLPKKGKFSGILTAVGEDNNIAFIAIILILFIQIMYNFGLTEKGQNIIGHYTPMYATAIVSFTSLVLLLIRKIIIQRSMLKEDINYKKIFKIEVEIDRYKTLIETDPRLKEFYIENLKQQDEE